MKNSVTLIGRLGQKPDVRKVGMDKKVASLSVSTWERWWNPAKGNGGEWESQTEWHRVVAWGDQCDRIDELGVGDLVLVEGKIRTRKYTDNNNIDRYTTEIVGFVKGMPTAHGKSSTAETEAPPPPQQSAQCNEQPTPPPPVESDDLPF